MSDEMDLRAAKYELDKAGEDLENARRAWSQAQDTLENVEERIEKSLVARATGPLPPVGDRVVRRSCALSEVREFFAATDCYRGRYVAHAGRLYVTNGHMLVDVDSIDGLQEIKSDASSVIGRRTERLTRADMPVKCGDTTCRKLGALNVNIRYATLVEDLFPGVEWWGSRREGAALAYVGDDLAAVVMGIRTS